MTRSVADPVPSGTVVVAVGGHESGHGAALPALFGAGVAVAVPGRALGETVDGLLATGAPRVCVVPMAFGRDERLVHDTAATFAPRVGDSSGRVLLTDPFGAAGHLVGWLRSAALAASGDAALVVTGTSGTVDDDAELYRMVRLVRQFGRHRLVEPALVDGDPDPAEAVRRCHLLGAGHVVVLSAGAAAPTVPPAPTGTRVDAGPVLLSPAAVAAVLRARVADAERRFAVRADTGIAAGLSHGHEHGHGHGDAHTHTHGHGHAHRGIQGTTTQPTTTQGTTTQGTTAHAPTPLETAVPPASPSLS